MKKQSPAFKKLDLYEQEIKEELLVHKASIKFLARKYGVSEPTITKWAKERGIRK
jgi:transposase-like protein